MRSPTVEVLDEAELAAVAAADPLAAENVSLRVPGTDVLGLGSAVAVHQRLGEQIDDWCITGTPADAAELFRRLVSAGSHDSASLPSAAVEELQREMRFEETEQWDFRWTDVAPTVTSAHDVAWLPPDADAEVQSLLDSAFPTAALQTG